jgi:hypothetical protein
VLLSGIFYTKPFSANASSSSDWIETLKHCINVESIALLHGQIYTKLFCRSVQAAASFKPSNIISTLTQLRRCIGQVFTNIFSSNVSSGWIQTLKHRINIGSTAPQFIQNLFQPMLAAASSMINIETTAPGR